jgi:hypothetical protein
LTDGSIAFCFDRVMAARYGVEELIDGWAVLVDERPVEVLQERRDATELADLLELVDRSTAPRQFVSTNH